MFNKSVNKVVIVGNLGKDPEMKYLQNGNAVANLTIATSESWKDKQTGERKDKTEWHRVVVFQKLGEMCGEYLIKGSKIYLEGKLQTRKWQGQDGQDKYTTEIVVDKIELMDGGKPKDGAQQAQPQQQYNQAPQQQRAPQQQQAKSWGNAPQQAPTQYADPNNGFDNDVPF